MNATRNFTSATVLKRDVFSETHKGNFAEDPKTPVIRRVVSAAPWWSRPLARFLARREIRALSRVQHVEGAPRLIATDKDGLFRSWTEGTPLHLARPADHAFYRDAHRLLRALRRAGVTHNDLAKPQNWLMTPAGRAAVIDFQLASRHRRRGWLFHVMAYEDLRHLLKQKHAFAPELIGPLGRRLLARRSLPSRLWMATGKRLYNFATRGLFRWSDGEGTGDRIENEGSAISAGLLRLPGVRDVALAVFPFPSKGTGIYAFIEVGPDFDRNALRRHGTSADLLLPVSALPRSADGSVRADVLSLIAMNRMDELEALTAGDADLQGVVAAIAPHRQNLSDRRIARLEDGQG
jgi:hypothetical protein